LIFFDLDATLLDHEQAETLGALDFYKRHSTHLHISENEFIKLWSFYSDMYFGKFLSNELSHQDQRRMRIKEFFGQHLSNEECDCKYNDYLISYQENWTVFSDVIPCLKQLKKSGERLGIISNGEYVQQIEKLKRIGIKDYFDVIVTSSKVGIPKPNTEIFLEACKNGNVEVKESYYVGDKLEIDALGSRQAGMKGIWLNRKGTATHPDVIVINSLGELIELIK
jgi:putative hydrolase of the HAD superfamily